MSDFDFVGYAGYLESLGLSDEDIVTELARVIKGEPPTYVRLDTSKITTGTITADDIVIKKY